MALLRVGESNFFSASSSAGSRGASVASFGDPALHPAQRLQHAGRAAAQEESVVVHIEHPEPRLAPADGRLWSCAVDAGDQASAFAGLQDRLDQAPVLGAAGGWCGLTALGCGGAGGPDTNPPPASHP